MFNLAASFFLCLFDCALTLTLVSPIPSTYICNKYFTSRIFRLYSTYESYSVVPPHITMIELLYIAIGKLRGQVACASNPLVVET